MISRLRIGIPIIGIKDWLGGVTYIELLVKAVSMLPENERPKIFLVMNDSNIDALDLHSDLFPIVDGIFFIGAGISRTNKLLTREYRRLSSYEELFSEIDFFFPVLSNVLPNVCSASWIPDFQHLYLPEFFSAGELEFRNDRFRKIAAFAKLVVLSSKTAEKDFRKFYPGSKSAVRILSFHTVMHDDLYSADPVQIQIRYHLPDEFLICSNQFWAHKNHILLFEALAEMHQAGKKIHLVCTGSTTDYRFPGYFMEVKQRLIDLGIGDYVHILGIIPRNDQLQLMRRASALVQPSLFEGWSTVVEDARALGKTLILSDLDVHKEQMGNNAVYFERTSRSDLVRKISRILPELKPGPDPFREQQARLEARALVKSYALQFCTIAEEAQFLFGRQPREALGDASPRGLSSYEISGPSTGTGNAAKIKVSSIVSAYNSERFMRGCLEDLINQTLYQKGELEIIVVDSGSEQNEKAIVEEFQQNHENIKYIRTEERETIYAAWNRGIMASKGKYITNANTDDRHREDALEVMARVLDESPPIALVYGDQAITKKENETFRKCSPSAYFKWPDFDRKILLHRQCVGSQPMWRRSLHDELGYFMDDLKVAGDYEWWLRISGKYPMKHIPELLGLYLLNESGLEHGNRDICQRESAGIRKLYMDRVDLKPQFELYADNFITARYDSPEKNEKVPITAVTGNTLQKVQKTDISVSAIVSTYNSERFMRGCLENLVGQTLYLKDRLEIVVVDSGSEQNEKAIVEEFMQSYKNIVFIRTAARESVYAAWNRGIRAARGQYVTNANTDDCHRSDALEIMCTALDNNPDIGLVYADIIITATENETFEKHTQVGAYRWLDYDREKLSLSCFIGPQPMWRKSLHDKYGYFDATFSSSGDWEFWLRIAEGTDFLHIHDFLGLYLTSHNSLEHRSTHLRIKEDRIIYKKYLPKYLPAYEKYFAGVLGTDLADRLEVYRYGQILAAFDRYDEAIRLYTSYLQKNPHDLEFAVLLDNLKSRNSPVQTPPPASFPEEVMAYIHQADAHIANNDLAAAREAIQQALRRASGHPQLSPLLATMLANLESPEAAEKFLGTKGKDR